MLQPAPITITKETSDPSPKPGDTFQYTVQVVNESGHHHCHRPQSTTQPFPLRLTGATWVCAAKCTGSTLQSDQRDRRYRRNVAVTLLPLGVTTFTITVTVDPTFQGGTITNAATATPGDHTLCEEDRTATECPAEVPVTSTPDPAPLTITKDQNPTTPAQGEAITYTVVVSNPSGFTVAHATFADPVPTQIVADGGWTTTTTGGGTTATPASAASGFPAGVALVIAPGGTVTFTITTTVSATYDGTQVTNTATATPGLNTECARGQATCQAEASFINPARLVVAKTHAPTDPHPVPGQRFTYTVTVTNPGDSATGSGTFSDMLPDPPLLDATTRHLDLYPQPRVDVRGAAREPLQTGTGSPTGVPITVAPPTIAR